MIERFPPAELDELNARDMAVARYRRRHAWMNEIFNPISLGTPLAYHCSQKRIAHEALQLICRHRQIRMSTSTRRRWKIKW